MDRSRRYDEKSIPAELRRDHVVTLTKEEFRGEIQHVALCQGFTLVMDPWATPKGVILEAGATVIARPLRCSGHVVFCKAQFVLQEPGGLHPLVARLVAALGKKITVTRTRGPDGTRKIFEERIEGADISVRIELVYNAGGAICMDPEASLTVFAGEKRMTFQVSDRLFWRSAPYGRWTLEAARHFQNQIEEVRLVIWEE